MDLWTPGDDDWSGFYSWCKKTDAWNAFTKSGVSCPSLTITSSKSSFLNSYRSSAQVQYYLGLWMACHRYDPNFFNEAFDDALDDIRVSVWRHKNTNGNVWKGIDSPSSNGYKLYYQQICFAPLAYQVFVNIPEPPAPELSRNELKALKAFAGSLEATQEFVPDSWFSPDIQMETQEPKSEEVNWTKQKTWRRRSLDEAVSVSRKVLRTALRRQ